MFHLLAQETFPWVAPIIQLVTAGGFGALAWYLVVKHIPSIEQRHLEERQAWRESMEKRDAAFADVAHEFRQTVEEHRTALIGLKDEIQRIR